MSCFRKVGLGDDPDPNATAPAAARVFNVSASLPNGLGLTGALVLTLAFKRHNVIEATGIATAQLWLFYGAAWHATGAPVRSISPGGVSRLRTGDITALTQDFNVPAFVQLTSVESTTGAEVVEGCVSEEP